MDRVTLEPMRWTWALSGRPAPPLQDRELQVLREIVLGQTNRGTGAKLKISEDEVMTHLCSIYDKTAACGRVELLKLFEQS